MSKEMKEKALKIDLVAPVEATGRFVPSVEIRVPGEFVAQGITELGEAGACFSIGEVGPLTPNDTVSDEKIAEALAGVKIDDPNLEKPDVNVEQGIMEAAALTIAKAKAAAEASSNPKVRSKLSDFGDRIADRIAELLAAPMPRTQFCRAFGTGILTAVMVACNVKPATPTISSPYVTATQPVSTEVSPTPIQTLSETLTTETPLPQLSFDEAVDWFAQPGKRGFVHLNFNALQVPGGIPGHYEWSIGDCLTKDCGAIDGYKKHIEKDGSVWYESDPSWSPSRISTPTPIHLRH